MGSKPVPMQRILEAWFDFVNMSWSHFVAKRCFTFTSRAKVQGLSSGPE
jgi:hypothetical protein